MYQTKHARTIIIQWIIPLSFKLDTSNAQQNVHRRQRKEPIVRQREMVLYDQVEQL